jgi:hypothetical protein
VCGLCMLSTYVWAVDAGVLMHGVGCWRVVWAVVDAV